jgi:hypothetical protein
VTLSAVKVLAAAVVAVLVAGGAGAATVHRPGAATLQRSGARLPGTEGTAGPQRTAPQSTPSVPVTVAPTVPGVPPSSVVLTAGLLDFADLGGFYDPKPADSAQQLASSPCLARLAPLGAASTAQTYFAGPDYGEVPAINEVVGGFTGAGAAAAYAHDVAVLGSCTPLTATVDGVTGSARLAPVAATLPPGDTESAFSGTAPAGGRTWSVNVGIVQEAQLVVVVVYIDTVPPSDAIYGNFPSTVAAAAGKLA